MSNTDTNPALADPLSSETCWKCGIRFAIPLTYQLRRRETGRTLYCPNGHAMHFPKPKVDTSQEIAEDRERLRLENLQLRQQLDQALARSESSRSVVPPVEESPGPAAQPATGAPVLSELHGRIHCALCGKSYKLSTGINQHLRRAHGYSEGAAANACQAYHRAQDKKEVAP